MNSAEAKHIFKLSRVGCTGISRNKYRYQIFKSISPRVFHNFSRRRAECSMQKRLIKQRKTSSWHCKSTWGCSDWTSSSYDETFLTSSSGITPLSTGHINALNSMKVKNYSSPNHHLRLPQKKESISIYSRVKMLNCKVL